MVLGQLIWIEIHQVGCSLCSKSTKKYNIVLVMVHTALVAPRLKCHSQNWHCSPATNLDVTPNAIPKLREAVFEFWQISHCRSYIAFFVRNEIQETKRPQKIDHENNIGQEWPRVIKYMSARNFSGGRVGTLRPHWAFTSVNHGDALWLQPKCGSKWHMCATVTIKDVYPYCTTISHCPKNFLEMQVFPQLPLFPLSFLKLISIKP